LYSEFLIRDSIPPHIQSHDPTQAAVVVGLALFELRNTTVVSIGGSVLVEDAEITVGLAKLLVLDVVDVVLGLAEELLRGRP
jgi:hypothetical protein